MVWLPEPSFRGSHDASGRHVASPPYLRRVQICPVLVVLTNPAFRVGVAKSLSREKKKAWSQNADVGQRSQCSAGDFGGGHDTQTYVSSG